MEMLSAFIDSSIDDSASGQSRLDYSFFEFINISACHLVDTLLYDSHTLTGCWGPEIWIYGIY